MGAPSTPTGETRGYDPSRRRPPVHARPLMRRVATSHRQLINAVTALITLIVAVGTVATGAQVPLRAMGAQLARTTYALWSSQSSASAQRSQGAFPTDGQGTYDSCSPAEAACLAHLDTLAQGGFQLVINYSQFAQGVTIAHELAYAAHAQQVGIRVIWPVSAFLYTSNAETTLAATYPALHQSIPQSGLCPWYNGTNYSFAACFALIVRGLKSTWGYYIGDELPVSREPDLRHLVDAIADVDPDHPRLFVAGGATAAANRLSLTTFGRSYCDGFVCHPDATVLAQDFYPIGTEPLDAAATLTGRLAGDVAAVAQQHGATYGIVLQSHSLTQYPNLYPCPAQDSCPYPTQQQMLAMRDSVLAHPTPRLILWYSYFDLLRSDNPSLRWENLKTVVNQGR